MIEPASQKPPIPRGRTAVVMNDMINANLCTGNRAHNEQIAGSGMIAATQQLVEEARAQGLPIVWVRVERRADRTDVFDALTDVYIANGLQPKPPLVRGSQGAENIAELPVRHEDQVILKPRVDPFIGTDLNLRLRSMGIDTILLGGYATNFGVEAIARTANGLNYNVVVLNDCCYNVNREAHEFSLRTIMPSVSRVMTSCEALELLAG
ncbi:MAG: cysteine hydrolase [Chloroflexota bacterium]|nr:cysteine hydrolase [Chloroflexota bacterium]